MNDLPSSEARAAMPAAGTGAAIAVGFAMARARLLRRPTALAALVGAALVVVACLIEKAAGSAGSVDRSLVATFNVVVPLVSFGVVAEVSARGNLRDAVWPAARYGVARHEVALGTIAAALAAAAVLGAAFAVLAVAVGHADGNPPLARDLFTSAWIAALTGAAYAAWFAAGATFGNRGGGRWLPLAADFVVGASTGLAGAILPRANAAALLGDAAPLGLPRAMSSVILVATVLVLSGLAALRCRE